MTAISALERGRQSFERRLWGDAFAHLSAADEEASLDLDDLERLARAAYLTGRDDESAELLARAHEDCLRIKDGPRAVRCAFWLGFMLVNRGEMARGGGWLTRAQRLLEEGGYDCVERGYLLLPTALQGLESGDLSGAFAAFEQVGEVGRRFGDVDLVTLGRLGRGQTLLMQAEPAKGVALLDEAMVAVTAGEVSPVVAGIVYCAVIEACRMVFDMGRAREWTLALSRWCQSQPDLVPYRGSCMVYRAEIMQLNGAWQDAMEELQNACERLSQPAVAAAIYQQGELHRLRGDFSKAEASYRQASQWGRRPEPGMALLRLAQGETEAAARAIRTAVEETHDLSTRARVLAAYVEIMLADRDVEAAGEGALELAGLARDLDAPLLRALAEAGTGSVLLAQGDARGALVSLRKAWTAWRGLEAPYEAAKVRVMIGHAYRELGDEDTAEMEFDAACWMFRQLGAGPDLARAEAQSGHAVTARHGALTEREVEVLRLVAAGKTNRAIAAELFISNKTVARHVSNIFTKLGLSSRSAATAYAYEHRLA